MSTSTAKHSLVLIGKKTDRGDRRQHNEDSCDAFTTRVQQQDNPSVKAYVAIVADGIGGAVGGKEASHITVETIKKQMASPPLLPAISKQLESAIRQANRAILQRATSNPELSGMGSTVVVAIIFNKRLYVSHVGDSRAYLIRERTIDQLTIDHTWVQQAIEAGRLTAKQAQKHPNRHVVTRYLGGDGRLDVDHDLIDISTHKRIKDKPLTARSLELQPGDVIMLCSDGLTDLVTDYEIKKIIERHPDEPQQAADELINKANAEGGTDNITAVVMTLVKERRPSLPIIPASREERESSPALIAIKERESSTLPEEKKKIRVAFGVLILTLVVVLLGGIIIGMWLTPETVSEGGVTDLTPSVTITHENPNNLPPSTTRIATQPSQIPAATETTIVASQAPVPSATIEPSSTTAPTTRAATSTLVPRSPTPTATPTHTPTPTPTPIPPKPVELLSPANGEVTDTTPLKFRVQVLELREGEDIELRMWILDNSGSQVTVTDNWQKVGEDTYETVVNEPDSKFGYREDYSWTVVIRRPTAPDGYISAPVHKLTWNEPPTLIPYPNP